MKFEEALAIVRGKHHCMYMDGPWKAPDAWWLEDGQPVCGNLVVATLTMYRIDEPWQLHLDDIVNVEWNVAALDELIMRET